MNWNTFTQYNFSAGTLFRTLFFCKLQTLLKLFHVILSWFWVSTFPRISKPTFCRKKILCQLQNILFHHDLSIIICIIVNEKSNEWTNVGRLWNYLIECRHTIHQISYICFILLLLFQHSVSSNYAGMYFVTVLKAYYWSSTFLHRCWPMMKQNGRGTIKIKN